MSVEIEPFRAEHLAEMAVQDSQRHVFSQMTLDSARTFEGSDAWTARVDGRVMLMGGMAELWPERALLWAYVSAYAGPHFVTLTRGVRRFVDAAPFRRIEFYVDTDFEQGHRWARVLGFTLEAERMAAFMPDGKDAALYARVQSWRW